MMFVIFITSDAGDFDISKCARDRRGKVGQPNDIKHPLKCWLKIASMVMPVWRTLLFKERIRCQISVQPDRLLSAMILRSQRIPNSVRVSFSFDNSMAAQLVLRDYDLSKCSRGVAHGLA